MMIQSTGNSAIFNNELKYDSCLAETHEEINVFPFTGEM